MDVLAVRYVKQGTESETAWFRTDLMSNRKYREATWNGKYGDRSHKLGNAVAFLVRSNT